MQTITEFDNLRSEFQESSRHSRRSGEYPLQGTALATFVSPRAIRWCGPRNFSREFSLANLTRVQQRLSHFCQPVAGDERRQLDRPRPAEVADRVEGGTDGAPREEHVVDEQM